MKTKRTGKRYSLLIYKRAMDRLWPPILGLATLLITLWIWSFNTNIHLLDYADSLWLAGAGFVTLCFFVWFFLSRNMAYVQPHRDHLRIVTPFLQLRISYRRLRRVHPSDFHALFPPQKSSWAQRRFLDPFYGQTAVVIELNGYPMPRNFLRLFLAPQMFHQHTTGLVLLVSDWMAFSTELESLRGAWQQSQVKRPNLPGSYP